MMDAYILEFSGLASSAECFDKDAWGACNAAKMYVVA
jgi:hypothetical protein